MNASKLMVVGVALSLSAGAFAGGVHGGGHHGASSGEPGKVSEVARTVTVEMHDNYYVPEKVTVKPGETVRFVVKNKGNLVHEFNIGTPSMHEAHQKEMMMMVEHGVIQGGKLNRDMMTMDMGNGKTMKHDDPNSVLLEPGQSKEVVWKFFEVRQMNMRFLAGVFGLLLPGLVLAGEYNLTVDRVEIDTGDFVKEGIGYNGASPGPVLRFKEGENVRINVTNNLDETTSIHWHGLILPFDQDGVPGISFPGIQPGETFTYEFPIQQAGTYWFKHPHSGDRIMRNLKMMPAWGDMRMMKADVEDIHGFTGLINGKGPDQNWTGLFEPGERIRLRFINSSAMTYFDVRIPGLDMTVVQAGGNLRCDRAPEGRAGLHHLRRIHGAFRICKGYAGSGRWHGSSRAAIA